MLEKKKYPPPSDLKLTRSDKIKVLIGMALLLEMGLLSINISFFFHQLGKILCLILLKKI